MASSTILSYRDLDAWKVAMELAVLAHRTSQRLPATERFELGSQIRRSATSIPANIAEGQSSGKDGRYVSHVRTALGSLGELVTHMELARRLGLLADHDVDDVLVQIRRTARLLHGLHRSLKRQLLTKARKALSLLAATPFLGCQFLAVLDQLLLVR
jgi:four helix bundle protein